MRRQDMILDQCTTLRVPKGTDSQLVGGLVLPALDSAEADGAPARKQEEAFLRDIVNILWGYFP